MARDETNKPVREMEHGFIGLDTEINQRQVAGDLAVIDRQYGNDLPYQRDRIIEEARFFMRQASQSIVEVGRRLILLKEHEGHGGFLPALEALGMEARTAQRVMKIAVGYAEANTTTLTHLERFGQSKMLELLALDTEEIKELGEGGTVRGLKLDDVDRMGVRELRLALRQTREKARKEKETNERIIAQKNAKLDELDRALIEQLDKAPEAPDWDRRVGEARMQVTIHTGLLLQQADKLAWWREQLLTMMVQLDDAPARALAVDYMAKMEEVLAEVTALANAGHDAFGPMAELARLEGADYRLSELPELPAIDGQAGREE